MNGTATGGKNLQTVFAVAEVKGAYEIRLISQRAGVAQCLHLKAAVEFSGTDIRGAA